MPVSNYQGLRMIVDEIRFLEQALLTPEVRSSAEHLDRLLSDSFVEFGSSGRPYTKAQIIPLLVADPVTIHTELLDFRVVALTPEVAHVTYLGPTTSDLIY
jgi:hypothetical protein